MNFQEAQKIKESLLIHLDVSYEIDNIKRIVYDIVIVPKNQRGAFWSLYPETKLKNRDSILNSMNTVDLSKDDFTIELLFFPKQKESLYFIINHEDIHKYSQYITVI